MQADLGLDCSHMPKDTFSLDRTLNNNNNNNNSNNNLIITILIKHTSQLQSNGMEHHGSLIRSLCLMISTILLYIRSIVVYHDIKWSYTI